jgi:hypothetical protein
MWIRIARVFIAVVGLAASPVVAETLLHGRYDCVLGSQGACSGDGPDDICLGARIRRGPPNVFLKLDFDRNRAELNGIQGSIHRDAETGSARIHWHDLALLGSPAITMKALGGRPIGALRLGDSTADFLCRPDGRKGKGSGP